MYMSTYAYMTHTVKNVYCALTSHYNCLCHSVSLSDFYVPARGDPGCLRCALTCDFLVGALSPQILSVRFV